MASSFGTYSMLVSLALAFMFIVPSSAEKHTKLKKICSKTINYYGCMQFMKSDSRTADADYRLLTEVAIDLASSKAKDIHRYLNSLYSNTSDSNLKARYISCSKNYNDALKDLAETKKLLDSGDYKRMAVQVNDAADEIRDCKERLEKPPSGSSNLKRRNKEFELFCDVVKASSKSLSDKS